MTDRTVTVRLRMTASDYKAEAASSAAATRRLAGAQRDLGNESTAMAGKVERSSRAANRALMYTAAGVAAVGAAGGALKALPPVLAASATAGAALPGILGGAASEALVLKAGLAGVSDALGEVYKTDDPFGRLAPNAKALVAEAGRVKPILTDLQQMLQQRVTAGTAADLNALATVTLPAVSGGLGVLADDWSVLFREITAAAMDPNVTGAFNVMTSTADRFFDQITARVQPLAGMIATLTVAADPVVRAIGDGMAGGIDRLVAKVESARESGALAKFFADGADDAEALLSVAGSVVQVIGDVVSEVQAQGSSLAAGAAQLRAYLDSGRGAADIAGIVNTLTVASEGLMDVVGPLAEVLRDAFADPGTAAALQTMFQVMAAGAQSVQALFTVFQLLPDPIQATVLAAVALAVVGTRVALGIQLMEVAAARASVRLAAMGTVGAAVGGRLVGLATGAGRAVAALMALQVAGMVLEQFGPAATDVEALGRSLEVLASKGEVGGEIARVFGQNLDGLGQAAKGASDGWFAKLGRGIEAVVPPAKALNEIFMGGSFTGDVQRYRDLDAAMSQYMRSTNDLTGSTEVWNRVLAESGLSTEELFRLLPGVQAEFTRLQNVANGGAGAMASNSERTKLLAGSFQEASLRGKDLATTLDILNGKNLNALTSQVALEQAYDQAASTVEKFGRETKKGTNELNLSSEGGQQTALAFAAIAENAKAAAQAAVDQSGNLNAGLPILATARERLVQLATTTLGSKAAAKAFADQILALPNKDVKVTANITAAMQRLEALGFKVKALPDGSFGIDANDKAARAKLESLGFKVKTLPDGTVEVIAETDAARNRLAEARALLNGLNGKTATTYVRTVQLNPQGFSRNLPNPRAEGGVVIPRQRGGVTPAAGGLLRPEYRPAGERPIYQWAEPETQGEIFLPMSGIDRARGQAILTFAASKYNGVFVPMARGGVRAAASGLVSVAAAAPTTGRASRLDYAEDYIRARDAVRSLSDALKENGRSFDVARAKGRANTSAVYSAIRAAQEAAETKFDETKSVDAANRAYDEHIARLRRTLAQQHVNAAAIRRLLSFATRPTYDTTGRGPVDSATNVAFARSAIAAAGGIADLRDKLSLNRPSTGLGTPEGRENLGGILDFLGQAAAAAQDRYAQTRNATLATRLYEGYVVELRRTLAGAGYSRAAIDALVRQYGKITLRPNLRGGVYEAAAGAVSLGAAAVFPAGDQPMYGFAEKSTGGELFLPRTGDVARGRSIAEIGAGWYGGTVNWGAAAGGGGGTVEHHTHLHVNPRTADFSLAQLDGYMRQLSAQNRDGRRR